MPVLVEANSVIVRVAAINERYAGGWAAFADAVPNNTPCSDNEIARVGFMDPRDAEAFIAAIERGGLAAMQDGKCRDISFALQGDGITVPCDWLEYGAVELAPGETVAAVQLKGTTNRRVACPEGWTYERSLSRQFAVVPPTQLDTSLKFLRHENGLDVYLNVLTGKEVFIGRTEQSKTPH